MSDVLNLFPGEAARPLAAPLLTTPRSNAERFDLEYESVLATGLYASRERNLFQQIDREIDAARQAGVTDAPANWRRRGGPNLDSAYIGAPTLEARSTLDAAEQGRLAWDEWVDRVARSAGDRGGYIPPTSAEIQRRADQRAAALYREAEAARQVGGGGFGGFLGNVVGAFSDPIQIATLPLGTPARALRIAEGLAISAGGRAGARILAAAAGEGAAAGATQIGIETRAAPYRVDIGLPNTFGENVAEAALGGAIIGGGLRGLVEGWRAFRGRVPAPDAATARAEQDAASLAQEQILADGYRPGGDETGPAHIRAADAATQAIEQGMLPRVEVAPSSPRQLAPWIEQPAPGALADRAAALVDRAWSGSPPARPQGVSAGFLGEAEAARLRDVADLAVGADTARILTSDRARHVLLTHGPGYETRRGQLPVQPEHLAGWADLVSRADETVGTRTDTGLGAAAHMVRLPDGTVIIVEEFRHNRGLLALSTMYRYASDAAPENLAAVPGMQRRMAESPPAANALRPGPTPQVSTGGAPEEVASGAYRFNAFTPTGRPVLVEPQIVELDSLIASHLRDGRPNPAFPHEEGVQPRDRGAAPSRDQVREIAAKFIPERLMPNREAGFGAPIVSADQVVESGNGRVMALRSVFRNSQHEAQRRAYLDALREAGHDITGYRQPVLISRRISALSPSERSAFVREANGRVTLEAGAAETAARDAERIEAALAYWRGGDIDSAANADFVRRFLQDLTAEERGGFLTREGQLSAQGRARIAAALFARAYGNELGALLPRFLETSQAGFRDIAGALGDTAGDWARMRSLAAAGRIDPAADATADLAGAVRALDEARRKGIRVDDLVLQADLDRPPVTGNALAFLMTLHRDVGLTGPLASRKALRERLQAYIIEQETRQQGPDLFGAGPPAAGDTMQAVARRVADEAPAPRAEGEAAPAPAPAEEAPVFRFEPEARAPERPADAARPSADADTSIADRTAPDANAAPGPVDPQQVLRDRVVEASREAEATRAAKATPDAEWAEAQRIAAQSDVPVPRLEGEAPGEIGARQLLDEADDAVSDAAEAAACLIGRAGA